jgi:plastocyanin
MTNTLRLASILTAATIVASCGGSNTTTPTSPSTTAGSTPVSIVGGASLLTTTAFSPNPLTVSAGTTVTWTNRDSTTHTVTGNSGAFNGTVNPNSQFSFTFATAGTFTYHCTIHPGMVATVTVQ